MDEYISREAAFERLKRIKSYLRQPNPEYSTMMFWEVEDFIDTLPAADVVEVVRCRDCIHAPEPGEGSGSAIRWPKIANAWTDVACPFYCDDTYYSRRPDPEGFCPKGERRTQTDGQVPE